MISRILIFGALEDCFEDNRGNHNNLKSVQYILEQFLKRNDPKKQNENRKFSILIFFLRIFFLKKIRGWLFDFFSITFFEELYFSVKKSQTYVLT